MMEANIRFADASAVFYATTAYCTDDAPLIELFCENMKIRMEDPRVELIYPDGTRKVPETKDTGEADTDPASMIFMMR